MTSRRGEYTLRSIDDHLGPATGRFFGSGYRRVGYRFNNLRLGAGGDARRLEARVAVSYPADWSTKATATAIRPHLSTVDALVLGARVSGLALTAVPGLDEESRRSAWLRRVEIKASATPVEQGLESLPVSAELRGSSPEGGQVASLVACRVGSMKLACELVHPRPTAAGRRPALNELVATTDDGPYGAALHTQRQQIEHVTVDIGARRADALASVTPLDASQVSVVSMVDAFVVSLQLGQVLLYELDKVERARSNTLWMRSTAVASSEPCRAADGPFPVTASLADVRMLSARGATWRTASIIGDCLGIRTHCAVAHELPVSGQVTPTLAA
jgi:hypothetical protein